MFHSWLKPCPNYPGIIMFHLTNFASLSNTGRASNLSAYRSITIILQQILFLTNVLENCFKDGLIESLREKMIFVTFPNKSEVKNFSGRGVHIHWMLVTLQSQIKPCPIWRLLWKQNFSKWDFYSRGWSLWFVSYICNCKSSTWISFSAYIVF